MAVEIRQERVYSSPGFSVSFQRAQWMGTPDTGPPCNLGALPVHRVTDYPEHLPQAWQSTSSVFVPVLPEEAIWLGFQAHQERPNAVQVALDELNVVTGSPFRPTLGQRPQNYLICPPQLHWDGICQMGSMQPFTAETLLLHAGAFKTLQIIVYEPFPGRPLHRSKTPTAGIQPLHAVSPSSPQPETNAAVPDHYGLNTWDQNSAVVLSVHFLAWTEYELVTGQALPPPRQSRDVFTGHRLP